MVRAGDSQVLKVIIIDKNGKRIESGAVNVDVMRERICLSDEKGRKRRSILGRQGEYRKQLSTSLDIEKATTAFDFDFYERRKYVLKFTYKAKDGREYTSSTMYNVEDFSTGMNMKTATGILRSFPFLLKRKSTFPETG